MRRKRSITIAENMPFTPQVRRKLAEALARFEGLSDADSASGAFYWCSRDGIGDGEFSIGRNDERPLTLDERSRLRWFFAGVLWSMGIEAEMYGAKRSN